MDAEEVLKAVLSMEAQKNPPGNPEDSGFQSSRNYCFFTVTAKHALIPALLWAIAVMVCVPLVGFE